MNRPPTINEMYTLSRAAMARHLVDPKRDINAECGYPDAITPADYRTMYEREGIAQRVVEVYPEESWAVDPMVYETEDPAETEFEVAWNELVDEAGIYNLLLQLDIISGVGHYGVLFLGLDDGVSLTLPVTPGENRIMYAQTFDEYLAPVAEYNTDKTSSRYGRPEFYNINFADPTNMIADATSPEKNQLKVHWTRCMHAADNTRTSPIFGVPRMRPVFNRLWDLRKILGGSGEMFWKGGFPGMFFGSDPEFDVQFDIESMKDQLQQYDNGLQRWLAMQGVSATSLAPNISDPESHMMVQLRAISITTGIPLRMLVGTEQANLGSTNDAKNWNKKMARRQNKYITPRVIRPFVKHCQLVGILPGTPRPPRVDWPDLNETTDDERAGTAVKRTEALAKYVAGNVEVLVPPRVYLTQIMHFTEEEADAILEEALAAEELLTAPPTPEPVQAPPATGKPPVPPEPKNVSPRPNNAPPKKRS